MGALTLGAIIIVPAAQVWILSSSQFRDIATFSDYSVLLLSSFELPVGFNLLSLPVTEFATMIILGQVNLLLGFSRVRHSPRISEVVTSLSSFSRGHGLGALTLGAIIIVPAARVWVFGLSSFLGTILFRITVCCC